MYVCNVFNLLKFYCRASITIEKILKQKRPLRYLKVGAKTRGTWCLTNIIYNFIFQYSYSNLSTCWDVINPPLCFLQVSNSKSFDWTKISENRKHLLKLKLKNRRQIEFPTKINKLVRFDLNVINFVHFKNMKLVMIASFHFECINPVWNWIFAIENLRKLLIQLTFVYWMGQSRPLFV